MSLKINLFFNLLLITFLKANAQLQPVGSWRDHLPYHQAIHVAASAGFLWAATPYSIFSVDLAESSLTRWSKINGLSEIGISAIGADPESEKLVVAYNSSQIDIISGNNIYPINALKNTTIAGDKKIYGIYIYQQVAYLATGIGIIVLDLNKYEIKDTYIIGINGSQIKTTSITSDGSFLYACTTEGFKKAPFNNNNLSDFRNWTSLTTATDIFQQAVFWQQKVIVRKDDSLFILNNLNRQLLYNSPKPINDISVSDSKLLISATGWVASVSVNGNIEQSISDNVLITNPQQAIFQNNNYWIADATTGLCRFNGAKFDNYAPNSPPGIATGNISIINDNIWIASGTVTDNWQPTQSKSGIYHFSDQQWDYFNSTNTPALDSVPDIISIAADPFSNNIWAGSFGGGLVNIQPGKTTVFKQGSFVQPAYFAPASYRISALAWDNERNLWISNYGAEKPLVVYKPDGKWNSFSIPFPLTENALARIVIDDYNQKWIIAPKGNGLLCFSHGQSLDNPGDDQWKWLKNGSGAGNLPDNNVFSIVKDKNGFIWVGTAKGIAVFQCIQQVFTQGCDAILPIVQQDNFAGYLFASEQVQAIAVDAADRKWVGTKNGVWLINADGSKTIYRFTEDNSPLLGNDIQQIAIEPKTGEVFIATTNGICSFRSTAAEAEATSGNVLVFPNPVPPGYTGTIAIRGVPANSIVKITEMDGRLVYQSRALGSQANWNGKNYKGQSVSSGVYLVIARNDDGQEKVVTKIVFVKQ